jgi:hypothetical protein
MNEITAADVQEVIFNFLQRCFIGNVPKSDVPRHEAEWVRATMRAVDTLTPADVAAWPISRQRALYDLLGDALILLGLRLDRPFPQDELVDSGPEQLAQPLLTGLAGFPVNVLRR